MAVAGNHDALFTEYEPAEVEHIYKASGLRCCTLAEFASWYSAEVYYEGTMGRQPSLSVYCVDAKYDPCFCKAERAVGRCRLTDSAAMATLPPMPQRPKRAYGRGSVWIISYLESHGGSAPVAELSKAAIDGGISVNTIRNAARTIPNLDRGDKMKTAVWRLT